MGAADGTRTAVESGSAPPLSLWLAIGVLGGGAALGGRRLRLLLTWRFVLTARPGWRGHERVGMAWLFTDSSCLRRRLGAPVSS